MSKLGKVVLMSLTLATAASGILPVQAAPPVTEPVPVTVQNTPTVSAAQSGPWTVDLAAGAKVSAAPRKIFRALLNGDQPTLTNETSDLLVIDRVSGQATVNLPFFSLVVFAGSEPMDVLLIPETVTSLPDAHLVHAMTQIYVKAGERLEFRGPDQVAFLSGHYEPMPQP
jgi:hypothetical protein